MISQSDIQIVRRKNAITITNPQGASAFLLLSQSDILYEACLPSPFQQLKVCDPQFFQENTSK
jgi:hypothetical protein